MPFIGLNLRIFNIIQQQNNLINNFKALYVYQILLKLNFRLLLHQLKKVSNYFFDHSFSLLLLSCLKV